MTKLTYLYEPRVLLAGMGLTIYKNHMTRVYYLFGDFMKNGCWEMLKVTQKTSYCTTVHVLKVKR